MDVKEVNMNDVKKTGEMDREKEPQREKWSRKIDFLLACVGEYLVGIAGCECQGVWKVGVGRWGEGRGGVVYL